jgi:D-alanine-D-alanine ligase
MAKVGLAYDLVNLDYLNGQPLDCVAELDSEETIQAIETAIESAGHEVVRLQANEDFADKLRSTRPDIVFNVAEGMHGDCRESQVPAMCEFYGIPYTGSGVLTLAMCLNKAVTNQVLTCNGVLVPPYQVFTSRDETLRLGDELPLIVKLLHEGSSMGLSRRSIVEDEAALRVQVDFVINTYHQPVLVQKFIMGREFTVGVLGNRDPYTLPITEVTFNDRYGIVTFYPDEEVIPMIEKACGEGVIEELKRQYIPKKTVCPADVNPELAERINRTVLNAYKAMSCRDWARIDLRMGTNGIIYVLELNPIAGIAPGDWLPNSAAVVQLDYNSFINTILNIAWERVHADHQPQLTSIVEETRRGLIYSN